MEQAQLRQLQLQELEILLKIDKICQKHHIRFFLAEGTLLGAVRHNGFIPWDDDIDIMMLREDYEHFLSVAPDELDSDLFLQHSSTVHPYWSPFMKVRLVQEPIRFIQTHIQHLTEKNGPCVDIFPVDNVPTAGSRKQAVQARLIDYLRNFLNLKLGLYPPTKPHQKVFKLLSLLIPTGLIHLFLSRLFVMYNHPDNRYAVNLASYYHWQQQTVPRSVYSETVLVDFEGHKMPIPAQYDYLLTRIYGDYMQMPPEEKRIIKHNYVPAQSC